MNAVSTPWWIRIFLALPFYVAGMLLLSHQALHYFQLESYQFAGYFKTLKRQMKRLILPCALYALCVLTACSVHRAILNGLNTGTLSVLAAALLYVLASFVFMLLPSFYLARQERKTPEKKPFRKTARIIRLYCVLGLAAAVIALLGEKAALIPVLGALTSGSITFVSFLIGANRLKDVLSKQSLSDPDFYAIEEEKALIEDS